MRLTLVSTPVDTPYSGMLPGYLAGHYGFDDCNIDLRQLCRFAGARLIVDRATGIDRAARRVLLVGRPPLSYDLLSIDIGSVPESGGIEGAEHAIPLKPVPAFLRRWAEVEALAVRQDGMVRIVVIGAGVGGVEATMALQNRMRKFLEQSENKEKNRPGSPLFTILSLTPEIMPGHAAGVRRRVLAALRRKGIAVETGETAAAVEPGRLLSASGRAFEHDAAIVVTQGGAAPWLHETGLDVDPRGFVKVGPTLQSVSDGTVFAAGDCAAFDSAALPKSGVYAVRQGPVLAENLRRAARGEPLQPFRPQRRVLALISLGDQRAVASKSVLASEGGWVWRWKDRIDRRWMARYGADLPAMTGAPAADPAAEAMRCGGCGAKVPQAILSAVLDRLRADPETSRTLALDSPDDAAPVAVPADGPLYQTVDQFRAFIDDPYLFGRIAANHCMGDIHAMGGAPVSALVSVTLPFAAARHRRTRSRPAAARRAARSRRGRRCPDRRAYRRRRRNGGRADDQRNDRRRRAMAQGRRAAGRPADPHKGAGDRSPAGRRNGARRQRPRCRSGAQRYVGEQRRGGRCLAAARREELYRRNRVRPGRTPVGNARCVGLRRRARRGRAAVAAGRRRPAGRRPCQHAPAGQPGGAETDLRRNRAGNPRRSADGRRPARSRAGGQCGSVRRGAAAGGISGCRRHRPRRPKECREGPRFGSNRIARAETVFRPRPDEGGRLTPPRPAGLPGRIRRSRVRRGNRRKSRPSLPRAECRSRRRPGRWR